MLKYKDDLQKRLQEAGYTMYRLRKEKIIGGSGFELIRTGGEVKHTQIDTLCRILNCRIDDVIEYVPEGDEVLKQAQFMSLKLDEELRNKLNDISANENASCYATAYRLLRDAAGILGVYPAIIFTGEDYIWISPLGNYDLLDDDTYHRFINGKGLPMHEGEKWNETWETMGEACAALGSLVAHGTGNGIVIDRWDLLLELVKKYEVGVKAKLSFAMPFPPK